VVVVALRQGANGHDLQQMSESVAYQMSTEDIMPARKSNKD
jgi:hypothetical protein